MEREEDMDGVEKPEVLDVSISAKTLRCREFAVNIDFLS